MASAQTYGEGLCSLRRDENTIFGIAQGLTPLPGEVLECSLFVRRPPGHNFTSTSCCHKSGPRMEGDPCSFAASRCRCRRPILPMSHSLKFHVSCSWGCGSEFQGSCRWALVVVRL